MNYSILTLGLIEIFSAVTIGLLILSSTYKLLKWYGKKKFDIGHNNLAYSIFIASVLFGMGIMVSGVVDPIISSYRLLSRSGESTGGLIFSFLTQGALYIAIAYTFGLVISLAGVMIYSYLTPIDEFNELKDNNIGVAIIVSAIIITLILMSKDGVALIIESMIPYPQMPPK